MTSSLRPRSILQLWRDITFRSLSRKTLRNTGSRTSNGNIKWIPSPNRETTYHTTLLAVGWNTPLRVQEGARVRGSCPSIGVFVRGKGCNTRRKGHVSRLARMVSRVGLKTFSRKTFGSNYQECDGKGAKQFLRPRLFRKKRELSRKDLSRRKPRM